MSQIRFVLILALLIAGATLATRGAMDPMVSLESLTQLWSDTLRDTDQLGMKVTRVSDAEETAIGAELARAFFNNRVQDHADEAYVIAIGQAVARHARRGGIRYQFHLIDSPVINAFALPGGQIFVTTGMLSFVESEAELAAILGHEISHVDLRHCVEHYQYEIKLKHAGLPVAGEIVEAAHRVAAFSFARYQEAEADAQGDRMSIESGYDPRAAPALFVRLKERMGEPSRAPAATPAGEVAQSAGEAIGSFFQSHPPSEERARALGAMAAREGHTLTGKSFYIGKQNLQDRVPRSEREYPGEYNKFP